MSRCTKCNGSIRGETGIQCEGVCKKIFHTQVRCSGFDESTLGLISAKNMVRFICDECIVYIHNIDMVLREMQECVNKNSQYLKLYKEEFDDSLKKNENEIKQLLEAIENRYTDRFNEMKKAQEVCEKSIKEMKNLHSVTDKFKEETEKIRNEIKSNNVNVCTEVKKIIDSKKVSPNLSYAGAVKKTSETVVPQIKSNLPLLIMPKEKQTCQKTREELNDKVDPNGLKIANIESTYKGIVVIESENALERDKIKSVIQKNMGDKYEIKAPNKIKPRILIANMKIKNQENEIIGKIRKQNPFLVHSELKLVKYFERNKNNFRNYNALIEVDEDVFPKIIQEGKLSIGWEKCKIYDGIDVLMCFKCKDFNHRAIECKNEEVCGKCLDLHKTSECQKEKIEKCINCIRVNKKLNMGLDENHMTVSKSCPVYLRKIDLKKKRIGY